MNPGLSFILYLIFKFLVPPEFETSILCNCEKTDHSNIIGLSSCDRFSGKLFSGKECLSDTFSRSGKYSSKLTKEHPYGMTYVLQHVQYKEHFRISVWRHCSNKNGALVVNADSPQDLYLADHKAINNCKNNWELISFDLIIPKSANGQDIKIYSYNTDDSLPVYFDDMLIEYISREVNYPKPAYSSFTDIRDGHKYKTIKIGNDWWMADNLDFRLNDSCHCYEDSANYCIEYGMLYDYGNANHAVPPGWKLPSDDDWKRLEKNIGMKEEEVEKYGFRGVDESVGLRQNGKTGFELKLAGARTTGSYDLHTAAYFWTSTETDRGHAYCREISNRTDIGRFVDEKRVQFSVRCIEVK